MIQKDSRLAWYPHIHQSVTMHTHPSLSGYLTFELWIQQSAQHRGTTLCKWFRGLLQKDRYILAGWISCQIKWFSLSAIGDIPSFFRCSQDLISSHATYVWTLVLVSGSNENDYRKHIHQFTNFDSLPGFAENAAIDPRYFFAIDLINKMIASIDREYPSRLW